MIYRELINVMSADELRNYVYKISHYDEAVNDMIYAQNSLVDAMHTALNQMGWCSERRRMYERARSDLMALEESMAREHKEDLPTPTLTCCCEQTEREGE